MSTFQRINQSIAYYVRKKVSTQTGLRHQITKLLKHFSALLKGTQQGDQHEPPNARNDKSHSV
jgi:hypothetical protein